MIEQRRTHRRARARAARAARPRTSAASVARLVVSEGLTVRQTEALVRQAGRGGAGRSRAGGAAGRRRRLRGPRRRALRRSRGAGPIRGGKRGGIIQIAFKSTGRAGRLVALLRSLGWLTRARSSLRRRCLAARARPNWRRQRHARRRRERYAGVGRWRRVGVGRRVVGPPRRRDTWSLRASAPSPGSRRGAAGACVPGRHVHDGAVGQLVERADQRAHALHLGAADMSAS